MNSALPSVRSWMRAASRSACASSNAAKRDDVHHEQRIALGALVDARREPLGLRFVERGEAPRDVLRDLAPRQQPERQLAAQAARLQLLLGVEQRVVVEGRLRRTQGADDQQTRRLPAPRDAGDEVDRRAIAPLQVLEHQQQCLIAGQDLERVGHLAQHPRRHRRAGLTL
jgi:hypothetical protein